MSWDCTECEYYDHDMSRITQNPVCLAILKPCEMGEKQMTDFENKMKVMEQMFGDGGEPDSHDKMRAGNFARQHKNHSLQCQHARRVAKSMKKADKAFRRGKAMQAESGVSEDVPEIYFSRSWEILTCSGD